MARSRAFAGVVMFIFSTLVFWGCSSPEAPSVVKVNDVKLNALTDIQFSLTVRNSNPKKLTIKKIKAQLWLDDAPIAQLSLSEPIILPKQSETTVSSSLALEFRSESDELRIMFAAATWHSHKWEVSLSAHGRYGLIPFHKTLSRRPLEDFQREFQLPAFF